MAPSTPHPPPKFSGARAADSGPDRQRPPRPRRRHGAEGGGRDGAGMADAVVFWGGGDVAPHTPTPARRGCGQRPRREAAAGETGRGAAAVAAAGEFLATPAGLSLRSRFDRYRPRRPKPPPPLPIFPSFFPFFSFFFNFFKFFSVGFGRAGARHRGFSWEDPCPVRHRPSQPGRWPWLVPPSGTNRWRVRSHAAAPEGAVWVGGWGGSTQGAPTPPSPPPPSSHWRRDLGVTGRSLVDVGLSGGACVPSRPSLSLCPPHPPKKRFPPSLLLLVN